MHKEDAELVAVHSRADCQTYTGRCCAQIGMQYWTRLIGMMDGQESPNPNKNPSPVSRMQSRLLPDFLAVDLIFACEAC